MNKTHIYIIDDDRTVCAAMKLLLRRSGYSPACIHYPKDVLPTLQKQPADLVLLDMNFTVETTGKKGLELLKIVKSVYPNLPIILITGWATVQLAVEGMKLGASDFLAKPWDNKHLLSSIKTILSLTQKDKKDSKSITKSNNFEHLIGQHPNFLKVLGRAQRIAKTDASVLIIGESGTGKELVAEAIHAESLRNEKAFVKVNLGGISSSLFESELFGHKKGAFTDAIADRKGRFELAEGGTIFLDEIGDLELSSQVKLLRVLQEKTYEVLGSSQTQRADIRVISATNKSLEKMIVEESFREDLYYRINLIKIEIPPLRERASDIPLLVNFYLENLKKTYQRPTLRVHPEAYAWLKQQSFPGNIRQLRNLVERVVLMVQADELQSKDFQQFYRSKTSNTESVALPKVGSLSLEEMEIKMIQQAMNHHQQQVSAAARALGLTRSAMYRRLRKYGISYSDQ
ncbi:MAG: sigma-54 dependent transcriptional regulator [Bacteroidota bacterium]